MNPHWCILSTLGKKCYDHAKKVIYIYEKCFDDVLATSCYNPLAHRAKVAKSCYSFEGTREHSMLSWVPLLPLLFLAKIIWYLPDRDLCKGFLLISNFISESAMFTSSGPWPKPKHFRFWYQILYPQKSYQIFTLN